MDLAPGTMVTPHVRLVRLLGEGGMGTVWVADHLRIEAQVAVKFLDPVLIQQHPEMRTRFRREATAAAKIDSPHVVRIFDHGEMQDGTPFIAMELLKGESLQDRLDRDGRLSLRETGAVVRQVCRVLRLAHKLGIVHRDIKPANVFLVGARAGDSDDEAEADGDLFVKILDFGIAKEQRPEGVSLVTMTGAMLGTPEFMSPEQIISSGEVDFRADCWAVAVLAYFCATGELPFSGQTPGAAMHQVLLGRFTPPSALPAGPQGLDGWFARAFAADPAQRFGSASDLARSLAEAIGAATGAPAGEITATGEFPRASLPATPLPATPPGGSAPRLQVDSFPGGGAADPLARTTEDGAALPRLLDDDSSYDKTERAAGGAQPAATSELIASGKLVTAATWAEASHGAQGTRPASPPRTRRRLAIGIGAGVLALGGAGAFVATVATRAPLQPRPRPRP